MDTVLHNQLKNLLCLPCFFNSTYLNIYIDIASLMFIKILVLVIMKREVMLVMYFEFLTEIIDC